GVLFKAAMQFDEGGLVGFQQFGDLFDVPFHRGLDLGGNFDVLVADVYLHEQSLLSRDELEGGPVHALGSPPSGR
ncbi:hypothetical protein B4Q13_16400, partial [Lacticaseibacillus rhamnosus]